MKKMRLLLMSIAIILLVFIAGSNLLGMFVQIEQGVDTSWESTQGNAKEESENPIDSLPPNVRESFQDYEANAWKYKTDKSHGTKDDSEFKNRDKDLPTHDEAGNQIHYREHDVNNKRDGQGRDAERFVSGSDGSIYYTNDHYETFLKLK